MLKFFLYFLKGFRVRLERTILIKIKDKDHAPLRRKACQVGFFFFFFFFLNKVWHFYKLGPGSQEEK